MGSVPRYTDQGEYAPTPDHRTQVRRPGTFVTEAAAAELDPNELALWLRLRFRMDHATRQCWPGRDLLAEELGWSNPKVTRVMRRLVDKGAVEQRQRYRTSPVYTVHEAPFRPQHLRLVNTDEAPSDTPDEAARVITDDQAAESSVIRQPNHQRCANQAQRTRPKEQKPPPPPPAVKNAAAAPTAEEGGDGFAKVKDDVGKTNHHDDAGGDAVLQAFAGHVPPQDRAGFDHQLATHAKAAEVRAGLADRVAAGWEPDELASALARLGDNHGVRWWVGVLAHRLGAVPPRPPDVGPSEAEIDAPPTTCWACGAPLGPEDGHVTGACMTCVAQWIPPEEMPARIRDLKATTRRPVQRASDVAARVAGGADAVEEVPF